jgi:hypothetical protein
MSDLKTWAVAIVAWGIMATEVSAAPVSFPWYWTAWASESGVKDGALPALAGSSMAATSATQPSFAPAATSVATVSAPPSPPATPPDAYLNFGTSSYPEQSALTVGTALPWYDSASVAKAFGHTPDSQEQQSFVSSVVSDVQQTFTASGLTGANVVSLTTDPNAGALHTMSIVSGLSYGPNPNAIGITDVGANGFGFIDKLSYATTPDQLEWAVAHNITHELMHAFGVAVHHDQTGTYLDAATANWPLLINPSATLSPAAVADIVAHNVGRNVSSLSVAGGELLDGDQEILAPIPEPSTIALWGLAATAGLLVGQRSRAIRRRAA